MTDHKKGGWMLRCPEVRVGNNRSAYFDFFFPSLATIHSEIRTFFFWKEIGACVLQLQNVKKVNSLY